MKYGDMFSRVADVIDVVVPSLETPVAQVERIIRDHAPDAVLVRGDRWPMWEAPYNLGVPYILDQHDVHSLRVPPNQAVCFNERQMVEGAAAIIFTSEDHQAYHQARYDCPPSRVVHLRPLASAVRGLERLPKLKGRNIVYAGGITRNTDAGGIYGYRSYDVSIFPALQAAGWTVHVFPCYLSTARVRRDFANRGIVVHDEVPEADLPRELSRFQVGLQAYANDGCVPEAFSYCMTCRPNKLWTYLAAGIPTVGFQGGNGMALYDGRWGLVADSLDELGKVAAKAAKMKIPAKLRHAEVMDNDLEAFAELVEITRKAVRVRTRQRRERQAGMVVVQAPNPAHTGITAGVAFVKGRAQVKATDQRLEWFERKGYTVLMEDDAPLCVSGFLSMMGSVQGGR
jgi:hypothetical protein